MVDEPMIWYLELEPGEERIVGEALLNNIRSLRTYVHNFSSDLALFDYSFKNRRDEQGEIIGQYIGWMFVAARDGAMQIYHFGQTIGAFDGLLPRVKSLLVHVDRKKLKLARERYNAHFENFRLVRHGVAHAADHSIIPERVAKHAAAHFPHKFKVRNDGGSPIFLSGMLSEHTYQMTVDGQAVSYDLVAENLAFLKEIAKTIYEAFSGVEIYTSKLSSDRNMAGLPLILE